MINLRQLKAFVAVAENRSFTRAAKILYMTQPAVSAQIKALEERLDIRLMERTDKSIVLTEAGDMFLEEARKILSLFEGFTEAIDELKGVRRGRLCLAASTIPGEYILPKIIGDFKTAFPGIELSLKISDTGMVAEQLLMRTADIGIMGAPVKNEALHLEEFFNDELIVIGGPGSQKNEMSLDELVETDLILREPDSGTRMVFLQKLKKHNIDTKKMRVVMELGSTRAIITAVESGLGLSVVSRLAAQDALKLGKIREVKIRQAAFERPLYLAYNKNKYQSYACKAFLKHLEIQKKTYAAEMKRRMINEKT